MIGIEHIDIEGIPALSISKLDQSKERLPTLIYYHGFRSGKENNLTLGYLLAEKNFRVILPDCKYHGERFHDITYEERELAFWDIVIKSIKELKTIKQYLNIHELLANDRIAVAGTSMGGMITAGALTKYDWIQSAGLLMSSGRLQDFAHILIDHYNKESKTKISENEKDHVLEEIQTYDLYNNIKSLNKRPLFMWHGTHDDVVPIIHAEQLKAKIDEHYNDEQILTFVKEENRAHNLSRLAIKEAVSFFLTHL